MLLLGIHAGIKEQKLDRHLGLALGRCVLWLRTGGTVSSLVTAYEEAGISYGSVDYTNRTGYDLGLKKHKEIWQTEPEHCNLKKSTEGGIAKLHCVRSSDCCRATLCEILKTHIGRLWCSKMVYLCGRLLLCSLSIRPAMGKVPLCLQQGQNKS